MNQLPDILLNDEVTGRVINEIKLITDNNIEKINFILVKNLNMTIDDFKQVPHATSFRLCCYLLLSCRIIQVRVSHLNGFYLIKSILHSFKFFF